MILKICSEALPVKWNFIIIAANDKPIVPDDGIPSGEYSLRS